MRIVADVHLHSHYSRATSQNLDFEHLTQWAQLKGVNVVGTGDIAHPGWLQEMKAKLEPAEEGLFRLKDDIAQAVQAEMPPACQAPVRFMLAGEISSIYKKNDRVRKVHNVIFAPSLAAVEKIQAALEKIGNIRSDGRPILGLPSRDLLEIILEIDPACYLIPAHIWTPWFSLLGSKSGYDSVEECFEDLTPHIFALETGLSSDPPMNWRISALDRYTLVSNSDAHSPQKLAREANLFETELSYPAMFDALKSGDPTSFLGTVEFFPEEGKYHYDGHRKCDLRWEPKTTLAHNGICPKCGKAVTVGVMHRVEQLADREEGEKPARVQAFQSLIPLPEILAEVHRAGPNSKGVQQSYELLLAKLGPELFILQEAPLADIEQVGGALLAEGIRRMRSGEVTVAGGYDGEYGVVKLFAGQERSSFSPQLTLLDLVEEPPPLPSEAEAGVEDRLAQPPSEQPQAQTRPQWTQVELFGPAQTEAPAEPAAPHLSGERTEAAGALFAGLNPQQREAVAWIEAPLLIVAGPGTGKTRTLTYRIAYLIAEKGINPGQILAITFTNKAAEEMAHRLVALLGADVAGQVTIKTFHAFGALILREAGEHIGLNPAFAICTDQDRHTLLKQLYPDFSDKEIDQALEQISAAKNQLGDLAGLEALTALYQAYEAALRHHHLLDFDDLILQAVNLFEACPAVLAAYQQRFPWISVDEYQDINFVQYHFLRLLTAPATNLCAIGDPDQAIYGFRGARREYFLTFQQDFPNARLIHLSQNYRSTQLILDASRQVIVKSAGREEALQIWSEFVDQTKLELYQAPTDKAEAEYVVHQIEKMVGGTSYFSIDSERVTDEDSSANRTFADFAVLYRLGAQAHLLSEALQRSGIPYQTVGQTPFYEHQEIKQILAYLWFSHNPQSGFYLEALAQSKKSIRAALDQLVSLAEAQNIPVGELSSTFEELDRLQAAQKKGGKGLVPFLNELKAALATQPVSKLIERIYDFIREEQPDRFDDKQTERVRQLILRAAPFENHLREFLEATVLQKETDFYDPRADRVTLMTLHASKGLEFPVVFIVGCEENLLPYQMSGKTSDVEEERRLFYVGMTRAQQKLILTHAKSRFLFGQKYQPQPSRFLNDIEQTLKELKEMPFRKVIKEEQGPTQLKLF